MGKKSIQLKQTSIPINVRQFVHDRDGGACVNPDCKNPWGRYSNLTIHHIIYRSHFGAGWDPCNLIILCNFCHDRIEQLKKENLIDGITAIEPHQLPHRNPIEFFDHEEEIIPCSHTLNNKLT